MTIFMTISITTLFMAMFSPLLSCGMFSIPVGVMLMFVLSWSELVTSFMPGTMHLAGNLLMMDFLQYWMSLMCLLIMILSTQASFQDSSSFNSSQLKMLFVANFYLVMMFIGTQNMFNLFIIFEMSIIPIFIIILGWGYQPEKIKAAYALFFFTAVSASPIVVILTYFFMGGSSMFLPELSSYFHYSFYGEALNFMLLCGFLVKLPIYGLHLWLPLAHVEAPVYGSMILAGILLKLGGLGILRLNSVMTASSVFNTFIIVSLLGLALIGAICMYTTDLKKIIAFSSVSHMAFTIVFLMGVNKVSGVSCMLIMISHAFSSSGMFLMVYLFYLSTNSRNILVSMGMLTMYPHVAFLWLMIVISSMGGPPAINLLAEVWCVMYSFTLFYKMFLLIVLGFMLSSAYHIILYSSVCQSDSSWYLSSFSVNTISSSFGTLCLFHVIFTTYLCTLISSFM